MQRTKFKLQCISNAELISNNEQAIKIFLQLDAIPADQHFTQKDHNFDYVYIYYVSM